MVRSSIVVLAAVVMGAQSCALNAPAPPAAPVETTGLRTIRLADGGSVTIEPTSQGERVVVTDRAGTDVSQSLCDPEFTGSYDQLVAVFQAVQKAVAADDRQAVAALIRYPLQVNGPTSQTVTRSSDLLQRYQQIFDHDITQRMSEANPQAVFCRDGGAMFADGLVWVRRVNGRVGIDVVNR